MNSSSPCLPAPSPPLSRRDWLRAAAGAAALLVVPVPLVGCAAPRAGTPAAAAAGTAAHPPPTREDLRRLQAWVHAVHDSGHHVPEAPFGRAAAAVGEQALGTPYEAFTLDAYLHADGSPPRAEEPLTLSLTRFDCVTLVEACLALARLARTDRDPTWAAFARETERLRYRGGVRAGYLSRLHYFSEWIADNARRGALRDLGPELGAAADRRPLRFMSTHRGSYPALADPHVYAALREHERALDDRPRWVVPAARLPEVADHIHTGDALAFATSIEGLDVTHSALAYRDPAGVLRVLHAPLSGGVVEVTGADLPGYVAAIRRATGVLVARPLG